MKIRLYLLIPVTILLAAVLLGVAGCSGSNNVPEASPTSSSNPFTDIGTDQIQDQPDSSLSGALTETTSSGPEENVETTTEEIRRQPAQKRRRLKARWTS